MDRTCLTAVVTSKFGIRHVHPSYMILVTLLSMLLFTSLISCSLMVSADTFVVKTESELITAINEAPSGESVVIALGNDIVLTESMVIPTGKNITLVSGSRDVMLFGAAGQSTIIVNGILTLNGIVVTHEKSARGSGVTVNSGGTLTLVSGDIFGNTAQWGGGVYNDGIFSLFGGSITRNYAVNGGGVYNNGNFTMLNGSVCYNDADVGGGIYNDGDFILTGGSIYGSYAAKRGGGVYVGNGIFKATGGKIWGNAANSGGAIWIDASNLDKLFIFNDVFISKNVAFTKYDREPAYDNVYNSNIDSDVTWSESFTQGYNNYDIGYKTDNWLVINRYIVIIPIFIILLVSIWIAYSFLWYSKNGAKKFLTKIEQRTTKMYVVNVLISFGSLFLLWPTTVLITHPSDFNYSQFMWKFSLSATLIGAISCIIGILILWQYLRKKSNTVIPSPNLK